MNSRPSYGQWTDTFTDLHHAATHHAPTEEIERLEAAELNELLDTETDQRDQGQRGDRR